MPAREREATCTKPAKHDRRIGWGKYGLHYDVPKSGVKILGGKPDVDYVKYVIRPKASKGWLTLWFGPYAMSSKPSEDLITGSSELSQRNVLAQNGALAGLDTSGVLKNGEHWRQTAFGGSGSLYQASRRSDKTLFDRIVNSMCEVPYPK